MTTNKAQAGTLLPCPFCNGEAHSGYDGDLEPTPCWCGCVKEDCPAYPGAVATTPEEAQRIWNTRPVVGRVADGWVKCSERMPDRNGAYLCWVDGRNANMRDHIDLISWEGDKWRDHKNGYLPITHWRPLPSPPGDPMRAALEAGMGEE